MQSNRLRIVFFFAGVALIIAGRVNDHSALFIAGIVLIIIGFVRGVLERRNVRGAGTENGPQESDGQGAIDE